MANKKITELTASTSGCATDLLVIVTDVATTPVTKKITYSDLMETVPWTDYSASSTVVGWSSLTNKKIFYKKIGKLVFVRFRLAGTSNATGATFTLPLTQESAVGESIQLPNRARDNTGTFTVGLLQLPSNSATVTLYPAISGGNWTNSGTKESNGEFWYEAAS